jgi:PAS domain S-box-containing protein
MKLPKNHTINLIPLIQKPPFEPSHTAQNHESSLNPLLSDHLTHLAFDNSLLANIISIVSDGKIIAVNQSACKLLGYSMKMMETKHMRDIFNITHSDFKLMAKHREKEGHVINDISVIKKGGKELPCQITSVEFTGDNDVKKAITTIVNKSESIRRQKNIDRKREKQVSNDINLAQSQSRATLSRLDKLERILDKEISVKENLQSSSRLQAIVFKKEMEDEIKLKEIQIADAITLAKELERSDLGKELHDNINQLLVASNLYIDIASRDKEHFEMYLKRSTEYTLNAIEEIRKLTKGLITDVIQDLGLCDAIESMSKDIMQAYPIKISCGMGFNGSIQMDAKFNLNIFRIVQEQINNIIKHAKASLVKINYFQDEVSIILTISDDGSGFDTTKKSKGIGILNIKSRAKFYHGNASFQSEPGKGCALTVTFPLQNCIKRNL